MKSSRLRLIIALLSGCVPTLYVAAQTDVRPVEMASAMDRATPLLPQDYEVELALSAGPEHLSAGATVYVFGQNGYEKVKAGTNAFTCMVDRDGLQAGDQTLRPTCGDAEGGISIVPVMLRVGELLAQRKSADEVQRDIDAGYDQRRFSAPHKAGIAYTLRGAVQVDPEHPQVIGQSFPPHYMIYAPGVSHQDIGIGEGASKDRYTLPFIHTG